MGRPPKTGLPRELAETIERIGANLRALREQRQLTQAALADASGVSNTTLSEMESRRVRDVRLSTLVALAKALDCDLVRLLTGSDLKVNARDHARLLKASEDILRVLRRLPGQD